MKTKFNFNSQVCTTKEQSERLLVLGLNKNTADMKYIPYSSDAVPKQYGDGFGFNDSEYISAWSLGRLIEMLPNLIPISEDLPTFCHYAFLDLSKESVNYYWEDYDLEYRILVSFCGKGFFSAVVDATEWLIKEGYFNKKYLV